MQKKKPATWTRRSAILPRDNIESHIFIKQPIFSPSYENDPCPVPMGWLLGWEYGRIWMKERDEYIARRVRKAKPKYIELDYEWWLKKRAPINKKKRCSKL